MKRLFKKKLSPMALVAACLLTNFSQELSAETCASFLRKHADQRSIARILDAATILHDKDGVSADKIERANKRIDKFYRTHLTAIYPLTTLIPPNIIASLSRYNQQARYLGVCRTSSSGYSSNSLNLATFTRNMFKISRQGSDHKDIYFIQDLLDAAQERHDRIEESNRLRDHRVNNPQDCPYSTPDHKSHILVTQAEYQELLQLRTEVQSLQSTIAERSKGRGIGEETNVASSRMENM